MKTLLAALLAVPLLALAAEEGGAAAKNPMEGWHPPKIRNEAKDKQEIKGLLKKMEAAGKKGDLEAAAALVDFPVTMATDNSKGEAKVETWDRDRWTEVMRPMYEHPMEGMKVVHKPTITLLSDSLASVQDVATITMEGGAQPVTARSSMLVVRTGGEWRVKGMAEGGWGDMMGGQGNAASGAQEAPSQGTGSGAGAPPAPGAAPGGAQGKPGQPAQ
jgi:hypothetical protein